MIEIDNSHVMVPKKKVKKLLRKKIIVHILHYSEQMKPYASGVLHRTGGLIILTLLSHRTHPDFLASWSLNYANWNV